MCRLGGVVIQAGMTSEELETVSGNLLSLLVAMDLAQGGDGVGVSLHFPDGDVEFVKSVKLSGIIPQWNKVTTALLHGANIVQMHARLATQGTVNVGNTHPFQYGPIVGAHNGMIFNDAEVWGYIGAEPKTAVDSEAIFGALSVIAPAMDFEGVQSVLDMLMGVYAITAVSEVHPDEVHLIKGDNPLSIRMGKKATWWASTISLFPRETKKGMITEFDLTDGEGVIIRTDGQIRNLNYDVFGGYGWNDIYEAQMIYGGNGKGSESCSIRTLRNLNDDEYGEPTYSWVPKGKKSSKPSKKRSK